MNSLAAWSLHDGHRQQAPAANRMFLCVGPLRYTKEQTAMTKTTCLFLFLVGLASPLQASDADSLARFDGGIGVIPISNIVVNADGSLTINRNIVRGVNSPGQIWVIDTLAADVGVDGRITVDGRGLLLGGGNNIGFNANASVIATLICNAAPPFIQHSTPTENAVPLEPNGDFRIDDVLAPAVPAVCSSPVLLIRSAAGAQNWFAAGIPELEDDDEDDDD